MATKGVGRPKNFDAQAALRKAVGIFWAQGYAPTSIDRLLEAMGIARSSFYATFGSKHRVMLAALEMYTGELLSRMEEAAAGHPHDPRAALRAVLRIASCSVRPSDGCLFINMATEMASSDAAVRQLGTNYMEGVDRIFRCLLARCGHAEAHARSTSTALMALATGAITLRKAGQPQSRVDATLEVAEHLIERQAGSNHGARAPAGE